MAHAGPGVPFPITFMSNVHMDLYTGNSVTRFRNRIEKYLFFNGNRRNPGNLEMALMDCYVPVNYRNVTEGRCRLYLRRSETAVTSRDDAPPAKTTAEFTIPAAYYDDLADLVALLTKEMARVTDQWSSGGGDGDDDGALDRKKKKKIAAVRMQYDAVTGRVSMHFNENTAGRCDVAFSNDLTRILGFGDGSGLIVSPPARSSRKKYSTVTGSNTATVVGGNPQLFVYCSAVKPCQIANNMVDLLAILPWRPGRDAVHTTQHMSILNPVWRPLLDVDFADISFTVLDAEGRDVAMYGANIIFTCQVRTRTAYGPP